MTLAQVRATQVRDSARQTSLDGHAGLQPTLPELLLPEPLLAVAPEEEPLEPVALPVEPEELEVTPSSQTLSLHT